MFSGVAFWYLCVVFQSSVTIYRWYRAPTYNNASDTGKRYRTILFVFLATLLGACVFVMKFFTMFIHAYIGLVLLQNLLVLYILPHIFTLTMDHLPGMDKTTARVRSYLIIIAILQLACLGASFSDDNAVGGKCTDERVIPYLMDIMLLLQVLAHVLLGVEYFCGYGTINLEEAKRKDEKFEIVKKRASADVKFFQ